jgi:hypothetical protein
MFIRTDLQNRFIPMWKSTNYINMSNVLRLEVEKNTVTMFTIYRPLRPALHINFASNQEALGWADQFLPKQFPAVIRTDRASVDPLALQAMADWDKEREEEKKLQ